MVEEAGAVQSPLLNLLGELVIIVYYFNKEARNPPTSCAHLLL